MKVFDLRMQRQLSSLAIEMPKSASGVRFLRFLQNSAVTAEGVDSRDTGIVMVTDDGIIQINDLLAEGDGEETTTGQQTIYAPIADPATDYISACAVSCSGQYLSIGTTHGTFSQYIHFPDLPIEESRPNVLVNENSPNVKPLPKSPAPPLLAVAPDAEVLGGTYTLIPQKHIHKEVS